MSPKKSKHDATDYLYFLHWAQFTMSAIIALGQCWAHASTKPFAMPALIPKRSSRDIPGFRGTPAGRSTRSQPVRHSLSCWTLVERFGIEPYSDFSSKWSNCVRLVLCCIDVKFCKKIFVGKLLTRSTRFTCFCTAQTSIFQKIFVKLFRIFRQNLQNFIIFEFFLLIFAQILMTFCRNFADNLENVEIFWNFWIF